MSIQTMLGRTTSSMYSPWPRMKRGSSLRFFECPIPPTSSVVVTGCASSVIVVSSESGGRRAGLGRRLGGPELGGTLLDGLDDVHVARAAAQVAGDPLADLVLGRIGVLLQQVGGLHDHAGGAEAALEAVLVPERLLERVQLAALLHALDRAHLGAVRLDGEHRARLRTAPVDVDGAGAAVARVAARVGAGEAELVAQEVNEEEARLDVGLPGLTVDGDGDVLGRHRSLLQAPRAREAALR